MKRILCMAFCMLALAAVVQGAPVQLYVDTAPAPGVATDADYFAWEERVYPGIPNSIVNMANGAYPGTQIFRPEEGIAAGSNPRAIVWVFTIPKATLASLEGKVVQVQTTFDWGGVANVLPWYSPVLYDADNWDGDWVWDFAGVIGVFGDSLGLSVDYPTVDGLASAMLQNMTYWTGEVRITDDQGAIDASSLSVHPVPLPAALPAGLVLLGALALGRRR